MYLPSDAAVKVCALLNLIYVSYVCIPLHPSPLPSPSLDRSLTVKISGFGAPENYAMATTYSLPAEEVDNWKWLPLELLHYVDSLEAEHFRECTDVVRSYTTTHARTHTHTTHTQAHRHANTHTHAHANTCTQIHIHMYVQTHMNFAYLHTYCTFIHI